MAWYMDTTRIFVQENVSDHKQIIARLQPVLGPSVNQVFGYESTAWKVNAYIVGNTDFASLIAMTKDGATHIFSGPAGFAPVYLNSMTVKEQKAANQTIRPDLDCATTVYVVDLELYLEEDV